MNFESIKSAFHPDDIEDWRGQWAEALETKQPYECEYRLRHSDGSYRWVMTRALPVFDSEGGVESWFGSITDIDAAKKLSESRELLAKELAHRIKNIFAVVGGLVTMRARGKDELKDFAESIVSTVHSLGRAQEFAHPLDGEVSGNLKDLLRALMDPYRQSGSSSVDIDCEAMTVGHVAATPIALIFHELATNSAKYGALSSDGGKVRIEVKAKTENAQITWIESGGPKVSEPDTVGFGSRLIRSAVQTQLEGGVEFLWHEKGLEVALTIPLERLNA